jgi:hypothetical protein
MDSYAEANRKIRAVCPSVLETRAEATEAALSKVAGKVPPEGNLSPVNFSNRSFGSSRSFPLLIKAGSEEAAEYLSKTEYDVYKTLIQALPKTRLHR